MSELKNSKLENNSTQLQIQKPFDIILNEEFSKYQFTGCSRNWFVPIVKEQSEMDELNEIRNSRYPNYSMERSYPKTLLEVKKDDDGNLISIYVLYLNGGKLYKVVSKKDYGVIKSRMELKNGKYVPYEKCELLPFEGKVDEYEGDFLKKSFTYKNGVKDGECFTYYVDGQNIKNKETNQWEKNHYFEKTTYKNGKMEGEYENTKYGTKGNYINNKKNGIWLDSYKNIYSVLVSSYQSRFDLSKYDKEKFMTRNFDILNKYDVEDLSKKGTVFYVNDVLNGEFKINGWEGKFELGLPNGISIKVGSNNWKEVFNSKFFEQGILSSSVKYDGGDEEENDEITYNVETYENGFKKSQIKLSTNSFGLIPSVLITKTNRYLNEDIFFTIVKNEQNKYTLESFLEKFVVLSKVEFETDNFGRNTESYKIDINSKKLDYGFNNFTGNGLDEYLIEECGYPYYEEKTNNGWNSNNSSYYQILKSEEYYYPNSYHPTVYSIFETGETTQLFIKGELINETVNKETNPIVLEFQKEVLQNLSNEIKSSYETEIKNKQTEEIILKTQMEIEREVNGFSINSFPLD